MDQIFRVVRHDDLEANALAELVGLHSTKNPVEAIALRGGAAVRADDEMHARIALGCLGDGTLGQLVIWINADEDVVIRVANHGEVVLEHLPDDTVLAPE